MAKQMPEKTIKRNEILEKVKKRYSEERAFGSIILL